MEREPSLGQMEGAMKANILTIKNKVLGCFADQMGGDTKDNDSMESNMEKVFTLQHKAIKKTANGKKAGESNGKTKRMV